MSERATGGAEGAAGDIPGRLRALLREAALISAATPPIHPRPWQIAARELANALAMRGVEVDRLRALERRLAKRLVAELARRDARAERNAWRRGLEVFR